MFEAEQKAKKAEKDIAGKRCMHILKQSETNVDEKDIILVDKNDESTIKDESSTS